MSKISTGETASSLPDGRRMTDTIMAGERKKKKITLEEGRLFAADLCSRSEQCSSDIRRKLMRKGLSPSQIEEITEFLINNRFLSDERFAAAFAGDKVRFSGWGRNKIRYALAMKGIPRDVVRDALDSIDHKDYIDALKRVGAQKIKSLNIHDLADRQKFYRHMLSRGFEGELVGRLLEAALRRSGNGSDR